MGDPEGLGKCPSLNFYANVADLLEVHGHLGASDIRWLDPDPFEAPNLASGR